MVYAIVCAFITLDFITGIIKGVKNHTFNSSIMREGLYHKSGAILLIVFGILVDYTQKYIDIGVNVPISMMLCAYIILMEIGSIIENIGAINPDVIPSKMKVYFSKLKEGEENDNSN